MNRVLKCLLLAVALTTAASADTVTAYVTPGQTASNLGFTTKVVNFDIPVASTIYQSKGVNYSGNFAILSGDSLNINKAPTGDNTRYISNPAPGNLGTTPSFYTIDPHAEYNYFGLYWGSLDSYNQIRFFEDNTLVASLTPADFGVSGKMNGDYSAFVNIFLGSEYNKIEIDSSQMAFESDNQTFGQTPEPGSFVLLGSGLLGLAGMIRRRLSTLRPFTGQSC